MSLSIRRARPGEAGLVLDFVRELAEYEKLSHEVEATEADIADALFGSDPRLFCAIAEWNGEPVGFAVWFLNFSTFSGRHGIYLEDLYVRPSHRGKGLGKALLVYLAKECVDNGWSRLQWAVLDWNAPSIAFYKSLGAVDDGRLDAVPRHRSCADAACRERVLMEIVFVVAIAENGVIGAGNAMPWRLKSDMARFKALTIGKPVIMGRKTFESLPWRRPLPNRTNIVITRDAAYRAAGAVVTTSAADAGAVALGDALRRSVAEIAVIGGAEIFRQWLDRADRLEITEVHARPEGDTHFDIDKARVGRGGAHPSSGRSRRQRRLLLCDISSAGAQLTAFANVYIDFSVPEHSSWVGQACVVRDFSVPYKAGPDNAGGGNLVPVCRGERRMPWKNQGGGPWGSGPKGPWGTGPQPVGPRPPDLEDLLRRGQDRLQQIMPGGYFSGIGITLIILLIIALWLLSGFFRVQSEEQGVVLRFGKHVRTVDPGLNYHLPYPIETVLLPKALRVSHHFHRHDADRRSGPPRPLDP